MAQQTLDFVIAQQVTGHAEVTKLINNVGALQAEMGKLRAATAGMSGGFNQAAQAIRGKTNVLDAQSKALRNQRQGMQQVGMQINDFATSVSTGASVTQAFNQQIGQLGYAMSMMGGTAGRIGTFLAGPWGAAITVAVAAIGYLADGFFETKDKAEDLEAASYKLGDAEGILGEVFDLTTGKIKQQNPVLIANAKLKLALAKIDAQREIAEGRAELAAIRRGRINPMPQFDMMGSFRFVREGDRTQEVVQNFRDGVISSVFALSQLQNKLAAGVINADEFERASTAISKVAVGAESLKAFGDAEDAINGSSEALQGFLRPTREVKERVREQTKELSELEEKLKSLTEKYAPQTGALEVARIAYERGAITLAQYNNELREYLGLTDRQIKLEMPKVEDFSDITRAIGDVKPVESLDEAIQKTTESLKETKQSFDAIGNSVAEGFKGMITGAQSFGDAMKGIISSVIDELFRLFVVQQIVGMVSKGLSSLTGIQLPARAMGGSVGQNKPYLVGERGPEIFVPGKSGTVIPTQNSHVAGSGGSVINVSVDARGATSPEMVRQQVQQGILEAAPSIVAAAEQRTITTLRRPRLAGAL